MRAGSLRNRGELQRSTDSSAVGASKSWMTYAIMWSMIKPLRGREYHEGDKDQAVATHRITMRYIAGVTPAMRYVFEGRVFKIVSVLNVDERNNELLLECTEEVD